MPINLFDCFLVAFLIAGLLRGRKNGISEEFMRVLKWLTLVLVCALAYQPMGALVNSSGLFENSAALVVAYLGVALLVLLVFSFLQRRIGKKLTGGDTFGRAEYYLGMGSGLVRYTCILLVGLALLHARAFTPAEVQAMDKYQVDAYGSTVFPTLRNLQQLVFEESLTGACIKANLGFLLINSTPEESISAPAVSVPGKQLSQAHRGT